MMCGTFFVYLFQPPFFNIRIDDVFGYGLKGEKLANRGNRFISKFEGRQIKQMNHNQKGKNNLINLEKELNIST